jgi:ribosomal protein S12 methylthiotransferase accessory factor
MDMRVTFPGGMQVNAEYKGYTIQSDQPVKAGGAGEAPSPFDLFLASLGTCAGFFVLRFCQERDLATDGIEVAVNLERDSETRMVTGIDISINLPGGFPEKYRNAVVGAANQCTVKKHLASPPEIRVNARIGA